MCVGGGGGGRLTRDNFLHCDPRHRVPASKGVVHSTIEPRTVHDKELYAERSCKDLVAVVSSACGSASPYHCTVSEQVVVLALELHHVDRTYEKCFIASSMIN